MKASTRTSTRPGKAAAAAEAAAAEAAAAAAEEEEYLKTRYTLGPQEENPGFESDDSGEDEYFHAAIAALNAAEAAKVAAKAKNQGRGRGGGGGGGGGGGLDASGAALLCSA